jgi:hypothetical protein
MYLGNVPKLKGNEYPSPSPRVPHFSGKQYSKDVVLSFVVFIPFEFKFAVAKM